MSTSDYGGYGSVQIGRLTLREALTVASETVSASSSPARVMKLTGEEVAPIVTPARLAALQDDLLGLVGSVQPVVFSWKSDRNGYWQVTDVQSDLMNWNGELVKATWTMTLSRLGTDTEVDLESRLTGSATRTNDYAATGSRTHAPSIGHYGYFSGIGSTPSVLVRAGSDGGQQCYLSIPTTVSPRWGCDVRLYMLGRVRFLDANDIERAGITFSARPTTTASLLPSPGLAPGPTVLPQSGTAAHWTLHNALVKVTPVSPTTSTSGVLTVSAWTAGGWSDKTWDLKIGGASIGTPDTVTVLRNEPEVVVIRLLHATQPGRTTIDLTLRRGSRIVEVYITSSASSTIELTRATPEAGTAVAGYVTAATDDGASNRYVVGSARTATLDTVNGGISRTSTTTLDAYIGVVLGGHSATPGDDAASLWQAYLGQPAELVTTVRR